MGQPRPPIVYFLSPQIQFNGNILVLSGIWVQIVWVEGEYTDHLTTTTALNMPFSNALVQHIYRTSWKNINLMVVITVKQALVFYLPRLFWLKQEEGRITSISDGVRVGSVVRCDDADEKIRNVARNVANYVRLDQAGHFQYGLFYMVAQVQDPCKFHQ